MEVRGNSHDGRNATCGFGDRLDLAHNTVNDRFQSEIVDLLEAIESRLKFKNPADLIGDKEMPTPELLAWAVKLKSTNDITKMEALRIGVRPRLTEKYFC